MAGKFSRNKGAAHERRVCRILKDAGYEARRNLTQYQETTGRDVTTNLPLCIQCKAGQKIDARKAFAEAVSAAESHEWPVAWLHVTNGPKMVVLDEEHFEAMLLQGFLVGGRP